MAKINYDTIIDPDRIDVYLDGIWVARTGSSIRPPPPMSTCRNPLAGFVGKSGTFNSIRVPLIKLFKFMFQVALVHLLGGIIP